MLFVSEVMSYIINYYIRGAQRRGDYHNTKIFEISLKEVYKLYVHSVNAL
jgi:hypothetical protein